MTVAWPRTGIADLEERGILQLGRGKVISKKDLAATPGAYPVYSSAKENDGKFGEYGKYMFDEELITWSVDGGGSLFHRPKHRFSITNVGGFLRILDTGKVDCRYLYYVLTFLHSQVSFDWVRKAHPSVIRKVYTDFPLPPLGEQKRIAAMLDQTFAALDRARTNAEANLADAKELFDNVLEQRFEGLSETYPSRRLIDFCGERGVTYGVIKLGDHIPEGVPCLRTSNVRPLAIKTDGMKRITTILSNEYKRTILKGGEVLVSVRGTLGGVAVVPPEMEGWNISREVAMVDVVGINPSYIAYSIATKSAQSWLTGVTKGAAYKGINLADLRELEIPAVDGKLQDQLVGELNDLARTCATVVANFDSKLQDIEQLRQSMLMKAFAGELA